MDSWEWPREFWHLPPPWEAEDFNAGDADYGAGDERYTLEEWEEPDPLGVFVSLEELEDLEEEAIWEEEFDPDDPTHLYLYMDEYEYLQQFKQPELRELIEEEKSWPEEPSEPSTQGPAPDDSRDEPPSTDTTCSANQPPQDG